MTALHIIMNALLGVSAILSFYVFAWGWDRLARWWREGM